MSSFFTFVLFGLSAAFAGESWEATAKIPSATIIGRTSPELTSKVEHLRAALVHQMEFWRDKSLPEPPPLDAFVIFGQAGSVPVLDVLRALNPHDGNFARGFEAQYEGLGASDLVKYLKSLNPRSKLGRRLSKIAIQENLFDLYCMTKYGFAVRGTHEAVQKGRTLAETRPFALLPAQDNAYFGRAVDFDLATVLKAAGGDVNFGAALKSIDFKAFAELIDTAPARRRVVLLPRLTEGEGANDLDEISALNDVSVALHENGHFINSTLAGDPRLFGRTLEEIFADYLAAAPLDSPLIGAQFARASGKILERLRHRPIESPAEARRWLALEGQRKSGFIRDLARPSTLDEIWRGPLGSNDYEAGHPGRSFLWAVRARLAGDARARFDALAVRVIADLGRAPDRAPDFDPGRVVDGQFIRPRVFDALGAGYKAYFFWRDSKRAQRLVRRAKREILRQPKVSAEASAREWKNRARREAARLIDVDGFNLELQAAAWTRRTVNGLNEWRRRLRETSLITWRTARPARPADYILPELFRSYYRQARATDPDLVPLIVAEAERVMVARALEIDLPDGDRELTFLRPPRIPAPGVLIPRLRRMFVKMKELRGRHERALARGDQRHATFLADVFERRLREVQNFERTGHLVKLFKPHPLEWLLRALFHLAGTEETSCEENLSPSA